MTQTISLALIALAYDEVWSTLKYLNRVYRKARNVRVLWNTFLGRPSAVAHDVAIAGSG